MLVSFPFCILSMSKLGFPGGSGGKKTSAYNEGDLGLIPGPGRFPWRRKWQPTPELLPAKSRMEKLGRLQSMGLQSRTRLSNFTFTFKLGLLRVV